MTIRAVENWSLPAGGTQRNGARTEDCTRWSAARQDEGFCNPRLLNWRNIAITLMWSCPGHLSVMAFHEKAGRSQVVFLFFRWTWFFSRAEFSHTNQGY